MSSYNHPETIPHVFQQTARAMVEERPVAAMARIKEVYDNSQRATVELLSDPSAQVSDVPVAAPFAADGEGDVLPATPGVTGIVLFLDHPAEEQLAEGGVETDETGMDLEDAVFLPAEVRHDDDDTPEHAEGSRVIGHPSGSRVDWDEDGRLRMRHANGTVIEAGGEPPEEHTNRGDRPDEREVRDRAHMSEEEERMYYGVEDNTEYPAGNPEETYARAEHPDGAGLTVTKRGVAVGNHDRGPREVYSGTPNDGERVELDGHHQHFHVVEHDNGEKSLAGPPLEFREFIAWMTDSTRQSELRNADQYAEARTYAQNYLSWLESEVGRPIDPADTDDWPDEEPMPTPAERASFNDVYVATATTSGEATTDSSVTPAGTVSVTISATATTPSVVTPTKTHTVATSGAAATASLVSSEGVDVGTTSGTATTSSSVTATEVDVGYGSDYGGEYSG